MIPKIYPIPSNLSKEDFIAGNKIKSRSIYIIVVLVIIGSIVLLPIIKVSISIQGSGLIRPVSEKAEIKANLSEQVTEINISEGQLVNKGNTLLMLRQDIIDSKLDFLNQEFSKQHAFISDLTGLVKGGPNKPKTFVYTGELNSHKQKLSELDGKIAKAKTEINRNKSLFEKEIISTKEFSDLQFNLNQLEKKKNILKSNQTAKWKADLEKYTTNVSDLDKQILELEKQKQFYVITSPVTGTIEEFSGIYVGSMLQAGQTIAVISPASEKIAEVYITAKDIGYLIEGQTTKIQVDAFNYNKWGSIQGVITDISNDFILADNTPVFKVKCRLSKDYLELKNGTVGKLKKGMTVNARFMIARRSLFELLYEKSDDWLNPSRNLAPR